MGTAVRTIRVSVGQNAEIILAIAPSVAESITVTAEAPLVDTRKMGPAPRSRALSWSNFPLVAIRL